MVIQQEDKIALQHGSAVQKSSKSDDTDCEGSDDLQKSDEIDKKAILILPKITPPKISEKSAFSSACRSQDPGGFA